MNGSTPGLEEQSRAKRPSRKKTEQASTAEAGLSTKPERDHRARRDRSTGGAPGGCGIFLGQGLGFWGGGWQLEASIGGPGDGFCHMKRDAGLSPAVTFHGSQG